MTALAMGANTTLPSSGGEVVIRHRDSPGIDVNLTAFLVGSSGKVRSDADMVFFNQPAAENDSARYHPPAQQDGNVVHRLSFDLSRLPASVEKVVVALTEDAGAGFAGVTGLSAEVLAGGSAIMLVPVPSFTTERGIMVAEVYLRNAQHKVRANWQGFASGLAGLATTHGVDIEEPAPAAAPPPVSTAKPPAPPKPAQAPATPAISFQKVTGQVNLKKGDKPVLMEKTALINASVSWRSGTDYDVYALVMTADGQQVDVATFGAQGVPAMPNYGNGAVRHLGDVKGSKRAEQQIETVEIRLTANIVAVVPVAYSAQSNGTGSFSRYKVSLSIDNGSGTRIDVSAENANNDDKIYSCVPGIIRNTDEGVLIEPLELYSAKRSEKRPVLRMGIDGDVTVVMDAGPRNKFK
ncbi:MAG: TerD family protein [Solirubrobacteraceae bacterium]